MKKKKKKNNNNNKQPDRQADRQTNSQTANNKKKQSEAETKQQQTTTPGILFELSEAAGELQPALDVVGLSGGGAGDPEATPEPPARARDERDRILVGERGGVCRVAV